MAAECEFAEKNSAYHDNGNPKVEDAFRL